MDVGPAPRRPRRWSPRAFGVVVRVALVVALVAMVAWPERHEFSAFRPECLWGTHQPSNAARPPPRLELVRVSSSTDWDATTRDTSLGVIVPRRE